MIRTIARKFRWNPSSAIAVEPDAVQLHPVIDEAEPDAFRDSLLERFELVVDELNDVSGLHIDEMVVVAFGRGLVARASVAEFVAFEDSRLFEQPDGAIDRRDGDVWIDGRGPGVESLHVRMVLTVSEHARDDLALLGDPEPLVGAQRLDVDGARHCF